MPHRGGQTFRRMGLLIEAVCMLGLISVARGNNEGWRRSGLDPSIILTAGLAVGFMLWAFGTFLNLQERRRLNSDRKDARSSVDL
ncbi:MAG: hypothetical protein U0794_13665 [Isosphaeraceae bacterium]